MDAQGLGRTHPLTPTRRLKQHTHAYNPALQVCDSSHSRTWQAGPIAESGCSQLVFEASGAHLS